MASYFNRSEAGRVGDDGLPDYIYYNGDVINNRVDDYDDAGLAYKQPLVQFNETRDTALVKDASKYQFSIVRFSMNGPSKAIPIWLPSIKTGQSDPCLTNYQSAIAFKITYTGIFGFSDLSLTPRSITFEVAPPPSPLVYIPENKNPYLAPIPSAPTVAQDLNPNNRFYNIYSYQSVVDMINSTWEAGAASPATGTFYKGANQRVYDYLYDAIVNGLSAPTGAKQVPYVRWYVSSGPALGPGVYYNVSAATVKTTWKGMAEYKYSGTIVPDNSWWSKLSFAPQMTFDPVSQLFSVIAAPDQGYGPNYYQLAYAGTTVVPTSPVEAHLFMDTNMWGLMGNFPNRYYNQPSLPFFNSALTVQEGYVYELLITNKFFQNVINGVGAPSTGVFPGGTAVAGPEIVGLPNYQRMYYTCQQDFESVSQLWSPVASIVFTTSLIPVRNEATATPVIIGQSNTSISAPTSQSAFQPIITDVALDLTQGGTSSYNRFLYYAPLAEYRMTSLTASPQEIRSIDLGVFWRNRLTNQLVPIPMYNLSNVSFKIMFRHKRVKGSKSADY